MRFCDSGDHHCTITVGYQDNILQIFVLQNTRYILNVCFQADIRAYQVAAFTQTGKRWGENFSAIFSQNLSHTFPTPSTMPGSMNKYKCSH
jgi:hypothetical protein